MAPPNFSSTPMVPAPPLLTTFSVPPSLHSKPTVHNHHCRRRPSPSPGAAEPRPPPLFSSSLSLLPRFFFFFFFSFSFLPSSSFCIYLYTHLLSSLHPIITINFTNRVSPHHHQSSSLVRLFCPLNTSKSIHLGAIYGSEIHQSGKLQCNTTITYSIRLTCKYPSKPLRLRTGDWAAVLEVRAAFENGRGFVVQCGAVRRREGAAEMMNGGLELTSVGKEDDERWQRGEWPEKKKEKLNNYFPFLVIGKLIPSLGGGNEFPPNFPFPWQ